MQQDIINRLKDSIRDIPNFPIDGIVFKDITPLLQDPTINEAIVNELYDQWKDKGVDVVAGIESRGFIWGNALALKLGVPFVPIRKQGKLPYETVEQSYQLEYGEATIEMHIDAVNNQQKVLIHDDLLATGGTCQAACQLVEKSGGQLVGCSFLVELDFLEGRKALRAHDFIIQSLIHY